MHTLRCTPHTCSVADGRAFKRTYEEATGTGAAAAAHSSSTVAGLTASRSSNLATAGSSRASATAGLSPSASGLQPQQSLAPRASAAARDSTVPLFNNQQRQRSQAQRSGVAHLLAPPLPAAGSGGFGANNGSNAAGGGGGGSGAGGSRFSRHRLSRQATLLPFARSDRDSDDG